MWNPGRTHTTLKSVVDERGIEQLSELACEKISACKTLSRQPGFGIDKPGKEIGSEKHQGICVELVEAEFDSVKTQLRDASVALAYGDLLKVQDLLNLAALSHETASFHIERLPSEQTALRKTARMLRHNLIELELQFKKNSEDI
jgi:hypothetical protein